MGLSSRAPASSARAWQAAGSGSNR
jgi:hypothetical protein